MASISSPEADQIAELVRIGANLGSIHACEDLQVNSSCSNWYLVVGHGGHIPQAGLPLLCQAAQTHPSWVDPTAVDLRDPLAAQLLELALSTIVSSDREGV